LRKIPVVSIQHTKEQTRGGGAVLHAVRDATVTPVIYNNNLLGSLIERDGSHELYIMDAAATLAIDAVAQTKAAYTVIDDILLRYGFSSTQVVRSWNYLKGIANTYQGFNQARDTYFANHGLTRYPAATGIESHLPGSQMISLSLEAIRSADGLVDICALNSDVQNEAYEYGPKFSRGMIVEDHSRQLRKIYISGTSHIDRYGNSIVSDHPQKDVTHTITSIEHLLQKGGATLNDIAWSLVYCKDKSTCRAFLSQYEKNRWQFPFLPVFVNVCRPDLNFEMECFAVAKL
jgi:enamine deaminase RidA (YjgF/YER057c/UK114 family)